MFVVYVAANIVAFAPSKFVGYQKNSISGHLANRTLRDGRKTNIAITELLSAPPAPDAGAEILYLEYCRGRGINPTKTGTFGVRRKFWINNEAVAFVEAIALDRIKNNHDLTSTEKEQLVKARIGQGQFRENLLSLWKRCCLSGGSTQPLLCASHIKPWSACNDHERLDRYNGLLLTPNADALFDAGYITFNNDGTLVISTRLANADAEIMLAGYATKIKIYPANLPYLQYHRDYIFKSN